MCKRLPGLRCVKHTRSRLAADQAWREALEQELAELDARSRLTERQAARRNKILALIAERDDNIRYCLADLNASHTERVWLSSQLVKHISSGSQGPQSANPAARRRIALNLLEGKLQYAERSRQVSLMPTPPTAADSSEARRLWDELARHRSTMACTRTQMALAGGNLDDWKHFRDIHQRHAEAGLNCHAKYSATLAGGASWWRSSTTTAHRDVITQTLNHADFTTPQAPATLDEVIIEVISQQALKHQVSSVPPSVDTISWAQSRGVATSLDKLNENPEDPRPDAADGGADRHAARQTPATADRPSQDPDGLRTILTTAEQYADRLLTDINNTDDEQRTSSITAVELLQDNTATPGWVMLQNVLLRST